jgi:RNA polymerase sigma-70 factor (ECF subfamily)
MEAQAPTQRWIASGAASPRESEAELVERAPVDREAFGALYRAHAPAILNYLRRRLGDGAAAEDLTAETFLKAFVGIRRFQARGLPFRAWLYRIATNLANSAQRRRRLRFLLFGDRPIEAKAAECKPNHDEGARHRARAALATLSANDQAVLVLRFVEGLSIEEAAQVLGCPPGTIQSRTARARERLRRRLERSVQS